MLQKSDECLKHLDNYESSRQAATDELLAMKKDIDAKLSRLQETEPQKKFERKQQVCSNCGQPGHSARTCKLRKRTDTPTIIADRVLS